MSENDPLPQAVERKPGPKSLQLVWIVPILAALIGGFIALKTLWERGPTITIQFVSGEGIEAGKTKIKHKSVDVGTVFRVRRVGMHRCRGLRAWCSRTGSGAAGRRE